MKMGGQGVGARSSRALQGEVGFWNLFNMGSETGGAF